MEKTEKKDNNNTDHLKQLSLIFFLPIFFFI